MKLPPSPCPPLDHFGLPDYSLLETEDARRRRIIAVKKMVRNAFKGAVTHLGEEEARILFARAARPKKRGRGQNATFAIDRDLQLLQECQGAKQANESILALAKRLHEDRTNDFGNTVAGVERCIRRLLRKKSRSDAAEKERNQPIDAFIEGRRKLGPTLLELLASDR